MTTPPVDPWRKLGLLPELPPILALRGRLLGRGVDVVVVGTGPTMVGFDWGRLAGKVTVALNDAGTWFEPTYWIFNDPDLWRRYGDRAPWPKTAVVAQPEGAVALQRKGWPLLFTFENARAVESTTPWDGKLFCRTTVATAGIQFAYKLGARRVLLLGIDAFREPGRNGKPGAYYGDGKRSLSTDGKSMAIVARESDGRVVEQRHEDWLKDMRSLRGWVEVCLARNGQRIERWPGRGVYNLSPRSRVGCWDRVPVEEALPKGKVEPTQEPTAP